MTTLHENIAVKLQISPRELERESLRVFLQNRLRLVESQLLVLMQKYGVQTIFAFDERVQNGHLHETEAFEEYFEFDALEAERDKLLESLSDLS